MAEVVRIVNTGSTTFRDVYDSQPYVIEPGRQAFVDYDVMCLWLGHPKANNFDPRNRVRVQEYARLRVRYGVDARSLELSQQGIPNDPDQLFREMRPQLEVFDIEGQPILTVADDPDGTFVSPPDETQPASDIAVLMARLQQMEQEQANLRAQLARQEQSAMALRDADPIETDSSGVAPPLGSASSIIGTITAPDAPPDSSPSPSTAPRPPSRDTASEDSPTRVRVSGG